MRCKFSFGGATTASKNTRIGSAEAWANEDAKASGKGSGKPPPNLDTHFVYHSVMKHQPDMVLDNPEQWGRFRNAPEQARQEIDQALRNKIDYGQRAQALTRQLETAKQQENSRAAEKLQRRVDQAQTMVGATSAELQVAFFFGPSVNSFDRNNPHGDRPKFRTDLETPEFMAEVTIGQKKKSAQLNDYVTANSSQRELIMYSPNISESGQRRAERKGFHVVRNMEQLFTTVEGLRHG